MTNIEKPRRSWRFRIGIAFLLAVIAGVLIYVFVVPFLIYLSTYEELVIWSFMGWTTNSKGDIKQVTFIFWNNGTRTIAINGFWVNGTQLNSTDWIPWTGTTIETPGMGARICIIPQSLTFHINATYNFTVDTTSGSHYYFPIKCDQTNIHPENLTILDCEFLHWPPPDYIGIRLQNDGHTPVIIKEVLVDGEVFEKNQWMFPNTLNAIVIFYSWKNQTYTILIKTTVGNTYEIISAPQ